ncbi:MAG: RpiB/LacA/LacB family sugar-phosphate isomerase [Bacteroidota bacterium]
MYRIQIYVQKIINENEATSKNAFTQKKLMLPTIVKWIESGIIICSSGVGVSLSPNRHPNLRAMLCWDEITAKFSRRLSRKCPFVCHEITCLKERFKYFGG